LCSSRCLIIHTTLFHSVLSCSSICSSRCLIVFKHVFSTYQRKSHIYSVAADTSARPSLQCGGGYCSTCCTPMLTNQTHLAYQVVPNSAAVVSSGSADQYMMGDDYMAAPVLNWGQRARAVYFPLGADWTHHYTGTVCVTPPPPPTHTHTHTSTPPHPAHARTHSP
jgi:hypothetical protein